MEITMEPEPEMPEQCRLLGAPSLYDTVHPPPLRLTRDMTLQIEMTAPLRVPPQVLPPRDNSHSPDSLHSTLDREPLVPHCSTETTEGPVDRSRVGTSAEAPGTLFFEASWKPSVQTRYQIHAREQEVIDKVDSWIGPCLVCHDFKVLAKIMCGCPAVCPDCLAQLQRFTNRCPNNCDGPLLPPQEFDPHRLRPAIAIVYKAALQTHQELTQVELLACSINVFMHADSSVLNHGSFEFAFQYQQVKGLSWVAKSALSLLAIREILRTRWFLISCFAIYRTALATEQVPQTVVTMFSATDKCNRSHEVFGERPEELTVEIPYIPFRAVRLGNAVQAMPFREAEPMHTLPVPGRNTRAMTRDRASTMTKDDLRDFFLLHDLPATFLRGQHVLARANTTSKYRAAVDYLLTPAPGHTCPIVFDVLDGALLSPMVGIYDGMYHPRVEMRVVYGLDYAVLNRAGGALDDNDGVVHVVMLHGLHGGGGTSDDSTDTDTLILPTSNTLPTQTTPRSLRTPQTPRQPSDSRIELEAGSEIIPSGVDALMNANGGARSPRHEPRRQRRPRRSPWALQCCA